MAQKNKKLAQVFHFDLYGKREGKYDFLNKNSLTTINWNKLENREPEYYFVPKDYEVNAKYTKGFVVNNLFNISTSGVKTHNDNELVSFYSFNTECNHSYNYKPFDYRYINYDLSKVQRHRFSVLRNIYRKNNIGLVIMRKIVDAKEYNTLMISKTLIDINFYGFQTYFFPLYLYPEGKTDGIFTEQSRKSNLKLEIVNQIAEKLELEFVAEPFDYAQCSTSRSLSEAETTFAPIDILDYIYAVLHSPTYREKYKEFLKIDFPRVPYPKDKETFWQLVKLGGEIRQIHLLESPKVEEFITSYPIDGDNIITRKLNKNDWEITGKISNLQGFKNLEGLEVGRIWINEKQYFDNIPLVAWEFYIGGYQPAQKWLKDRRGRQLSFEDILHYQKIIVALTETDRLMKEVDGIEIEENFKSLKYEE